MPPPGRPRMVPAPTGTTTTLLLRSWCASMNTPVSLGGWFGFAIAGPIRGRPGDDGEEAVLTRSGLQASVAARERGPESAGPDRPSRANRRKTEPSTTAKCRKLNLCPSGFRRPARLCRTRPRGAPSTTACRPRSSASTSACLTRPCDAGHLVAYGQETGVSTAQMAILMAFRASY